MVASLQSSGVAPACGHGPLTTAFTIGVPCRVWDVRVAAPVRTLATGGVVTSIELSKDGRHLTTADGKEVKVHASAPLVQTAHDCDAPAELTALQDACFGHTMYGTDRLTATQCHGVRMSRLAPCVFRGFEDAR